MKMKVLFNGPLEAAEVFRGPVAGSLTTAGFSLPSLGSCAGVGLVPVECLATGAASALQHFYNTSAGGVL